MTSDAKITHPYDISKPFLEKIGKIFLYSLLLHVSEEFFGFPSLNPPMNVHCKKPTALICLTPRIYCLTLNTQSLTLTAQSLTFSLSQMTKEKFTLPLAWRENEGYNPTINARFFMKQFSLSKKNYLFSSARYVFSKKFFPFFIIHFSPNISGSRKSLRYFCSNLII